MYVMSSLPPHQQSLAGGIFNTVTKICSAIGLGISASIYNAESSGTAALQTTIKPYRSVFLFCVASAGLGLCFVPFLTIETQGHESKASSVANFADEKVNDEAKEAGNIISKNMPPGEKEEQ
jgi:hypothetical protein